MPALVFLAFLAVGGLVLVSLVEIDRSGVPSVSHHGYLPYTNKGRVAAPANAPDMTSQVVLAAQPKSGPEHQATMPAEARAARAEAPSKKARIEASAKKARAEATPPPDKPSTRPTTYQQAPFFDKFSIKDY